MVGGCTDNKWVNGWLNTFMGSSVDCLLFHWMAQHNVKKLPLFQHSITVFHGNTQAFWEAVSWFVHLFSCFCLLQTLFPTSQWFFLASVLMTFLPLFPPVCHLFFIALRCQMVALSPKKRTFIFYELLPANMFWKNRDATLIAFFINIIKKCFQWTFANSQNVHPEYTVSAKCSLPLYFS